MSAAVGTAANSPLFREAVETVLRAWPAFGFAVANATGGSETPAKARWLVGVLVGYFADSNPDEISPSDVADFVSDIMDVEFDVFVEDGSTDDVGRDLCDAFRLLLGGSGSEPALRAKLAALKPADLSCFKDGTPATAVPEVETVEGNDSEGDDGGEDEVDGRAINDGLAGRLHGVGISQQVERQSGASASSSAPVVDAMETDGDDDGWKVVTKGGRKKR